MCTTCPNISLVHQHIKISAKRWWQLSPCISDQPPTKTMSTSLSIIMLMAFSQMLMMTNGKWWKWGEQHFDHPVACFSGAGRPSIIDPYDLCPWYLIRCPLEIHFCIYETVNQILLKITFNVSLQVAVRSSMLDSDWLKDFWRSASPVLLVLVVPSLFPANQSYQERQKIEHPIFFF